MVRHRFEAYLDKVFDFLRRVRDLPDGRLYPRHALSKIVSAVFLGAACQFRSFHQIEAECRSGSLAHRIGPVSAEDLGYALNRLKPEALLDLCCTVAKTLKRNGLLASEWARGRHVVAVDGIEICSSYSRCCDLCMERKTDRLLDGKLVEDVQYYHRIVAITFVSSRFAIPLAIEFQRQGETEVACALRLLKAVRKKLGARFFDVVVADALFLQYPFITELEDMGLDWAITLKDNQPELLKAAKRATETEPGEKHDSPNDSVLLRYCPRVYWPAADRVIPVLRADRVQTPWRVDIAVDASGKRTAQKKRVQEESTVFYATNINLGLKPVAFLYRLARSRWLIDTSVFQSITTNGNLKEPSVHQDQGVALINLTQLRILAYVLSLVFYHRQVLSHPGKASRLTFRQLARMLRYWFAGLPDTS